jgi:hypothetical protein
MLDKHTAYFNILSALPQPGCVLCRLGHDVETRYIRDILYSKTTSIKTRGELREARGFCMAHARQLDEIGHALDLSIIYQDILMTLKEALEKPSPRQALSRRGKRQLSGELAPKDGCPACVYRTSIEAVYAETIADHVAEPDFVAKMRVADPLCLVHFRRIMEELFDPELYRALRDVQTAHWDRLIAELGEFVRKHDHRFRHEAIGQEGTAWIRAIDAIVGTRKF